MQPITTVHYLVLSAALLLIGTVGVLTRRNIVIILMSIELILNAVNINLIAFSHVLRQRQRADLRHLRDHRRGGRGGRGAGHPDRAVPQQGNRAGGRNRLAEVVSATMNFLDSIWLIPLFPLFGAAMMLLLGRRLPKSRQSACSVPGMVLLSFIFSAGRRVAAFGLHREGPRGHPVPAGCRRSRPTGAFCSIRSAP